MKGIVISAIQMILKEMFKYFLPKPYRRILAELMASQIPQRLIDIENDFTSFQSIMVRHQYNQLSNPAYLPSINNFEARIYSQNGEDGILMYLFSQIGVKSRTCVEFGIQDGRECNCASLCINFGWRGIFLECDDEYVASARLYFQTKLGFFNIRYQLDAKTFIIDGSD